tara:strand:+ start:120 stop:338 length:219 start_codon:yes stop_codon:yes gene_type:complete
VVVHNQLGKLDHILGLPQVVDALLQVVDALPQVVDASEQVVDALEQQLVVVGQRIEGAHRIHSILPLSSHHP